MQQNLPLYLPLGQVETLFFLCLAEFNVCDMWLQLVLYMFGKYHMLSQLVKVSLGKMDS